MSSESGLNFGVGFGLAMGSAAMMDKIKQHPGNVRRRQNHQDGFLRKLFRCFSGKKKPKASG